jgi:hypothetical protein
MVNRSRECEAGGVDHNRGAAFVPAFEFYIASSRSSALGFRVVLAKDAARAREIAETILRESPAYTGVEVRQASRWLFGIGSLARTEERAS